MYEIGVELGALLLFVEHRYFGETQPFGDQSPKCISSLTSLLSTTHTLSPSPPPPLFLPLYPFPFTSRFSSPSHYISFFYAHAFLLKNSQSFSDWPDLNYLSVCFLSFHIFISFPSSSLLLLPSPLHTTIL